MGPLGPTQLYCRSCAIFLPCRNLLSCENGENSEQPMLSAADVQRMASTVQSQHSTCNSGIAFTPLDGSPTQNGAVSSSIPAVPAEFQNETTEHYVAYREYRAYDYVHLTNRLDSRVMTQPLGHSYAVMWSLCGPMYALSLMKSH